jgi:light-regulated signal transduction histidine kinase (bacteriophytochrome)
MTMHMHDITRTLISNDFILANIYSLFPDSIFLNKEFKILGMSNNICAHLGYTNEMLSGKSLSVLQVDGNLEQLVRERLQMGYFNNEAIKLSASDQQATSYSVSGFYLGLLTECNGCIVLRCVNKEEVESMERQLLTTKKHIDNFVYRAAHDLRGPLATMLGLINLLKIRKDDSEVNRFIDMIEMHGNKLDERLHQVVYLSKIDEEISAPTFRLNFSKLETELRKTIEKNAFVDFLELTVVSKKPIVTGYNEIHIHSILTNILQYFLSRPTCSTDSSIRVTANETYSGLTISLKAQGFVTDPEIQINMRDMDNGRYSQLLQSSKFTNLFAAQKVALQSKAFISVEQISAECEQINVWIPRSIQENTLINQ